MRRAPRIPVAWVVSTVLVVASACGGNGAGTGGGRDDAGIINGGGDAGDEAGHDATAGACTSDSQCAGSVPPSVPTGCASGKCNAVQGACEYVAKDQDGDGHSAADCTSTNAVPILAGDDCNDHDPLLYPGHPEPCMTLPDGGSVGIGYCAPGAISCLPDHTQSGCANTTVCVNQTCSAEKCVGECSPGQTACANNAAESCTTAGAFGAAIPCINQTCLGGVTVGDGGGGPAGCEGKCSPGQFYCSGAQPQSCGPDGQWQNLGAPCSGNTPACDNTRGTCGQCTAPSQRCNGTQPQTCGVTDGWQDTGQACTGALPACVNGACVVCNPGAQTCAGQQPQICDATGAWRSNGAPCANQTCVAATGICTGTCAPGQQECNGNAVWQCNSAGAYAASMTCVKQTCLQSGTTAVCGGVCGPGQVNCSGQQPQACGNDGKWQNSGLVCSGATPACSNGACSPPPPSCQTAGSGRTNCGASSESCCTSLEVTGGSYDRTYVNNGLGPTGGTDAATVSSFHLDKYEVTVGRFRQFVAAWNNGVGYTPPAGSGKHTHLNGGSGLNATGGGYEPGWVTADNVNVAPTDANLECWPTYQTWTAAAGANENLPMNCANWWETYAFCIWDGGFLPSEAEWEYAAAGGSQELEYPWGSTAPGTANQYAIYGCFFPGGSGSCTGATNIAPVGTATSGAAAWGQLDLAGNLFEWNLDWYAPYVEPCSDCANLTAATNRIARGGFYYGVVSGLLPPFRDNLPPANPNYNVGFRCARVP